MSRKSKQARAHEFSPIDRQRIMERDYNECIFCKIGYRTSGATWFGREIKSIMHYIPRSKGGLGIPKNGAVGCQYHHELLDNGNKGLRPEMLRIFKRYLMQQYPDWNEADLVYKKWNFPNIG